MNREEAINMLYGMRADNLNLDDAYTKDKYDALDMAIKALKHEPKFMAKSDGTIEQIKNCNDCLFKKEWEKIGKLLSVVLEKQTEQGSRWVSVSERLPEDRRAVLVTAYWHETYQVMMASYYGDGLWWCVPFNNCGEHMQKLKPKAWMPLPQAYREVEE